MTPTPGTGATVICTLGMHRSGTSLVSRLLNLLGVHLGPEALVSTRGADNLKGYWEHSAFVEIDDAILARFGGRWDDPPPFPPAWKDDPRLADLRERACRLVAGDFAGQPLWGWKDPRTCLTLPFWRDVVGPMRYVLCLRSPGAVAASLAQRNGFAWDKAERLWLAHVQASLSGTGGEPRLTVFYEDVLSDWPAEVRRLAAFVGAPERAEDPRLREAMACFVDEELCHHLGSTQDLVADERIGFPALGLYLALRDRAASPPLLDAVAGRALTASKERASLLAAGDARAASLRALTLQNREQAAALAALAHRGEEQGRALAALGDALDAVHASRGWRLVLAFRRVAASWLPAGTRRRRACDALLRPLARRLSPHAPRAASRLPTAP